MSFENPDWRLEIWHAGAKAAEISNDEWERVLSDLVQFSETRRREVQRGPAPANGHGAEAEAEVGAEDEALAEPPSTYWAHFAAAAIQRKEVTPESAATMADELLAEYVKRFQEAA